MIRLTTSLVHYLSAYTPIYAISVLQIIIPWVTATALDRQLEAFRLTDMLGGNASVIRGVVLG